jgi:hypothetical protein
MKVKINGRIFKVHKEEYNRIKITKNIDIFNLMFFKEWFLQGIDNPKIDYKHNIPYSSKLGYGRLLNCFPCEMGEDYVILVYDKIETITTVIE